MIYWFARHFLAVEDKIGLSVNDIRSNIEQFVLEYQKNYSEMSDKDKKRLEEIKAFLSGKRFGDEILPAIPTFKD